MADLAGLIECIGKLTGPDREVDAEIVRHFHGTEEARLRLCYDIDAYCFTSSLDAAIALVERVLSDRNRTIRKRFRTTGGSIDGHIFDAHISGGDVCEGSTEAIALLIAMFRALSQEAKP